MSMFMLENASVHMWNMKQRQRGLGMQAESVCNIATKESSKENILEELVLWQVSHFLADQQVELSLDDF